MEKLLTIAIPSYNAGWCLDKCLASFVDPTVLDRLEVIVINDGSTDNTLTIAQRYKERYPHVFQIINKENGGHGSGINAAIRQATGEFFKVVDADDWVLTESLVPFLEVLESTEADAILTHFHTVDMTTGKRREYKTRGIPLGRIYSLEEYTALPGEIYPCASLHGLTYRTEVYRESGTVLSEGIFYEDQEYATLPFLKVRTVLPLDMFLYEYLVGNVNQSMADANQVKRLHHMEQVTERLFQCGHSSRDLSGSTQRYIARKAGEMLGSYYFTVMVKNPDKKEGRKRAAQFRDKAHLQDPFIATAADGKYRAALAMNRLRLGGKLLNLLKSPAPYALYRWLIKRNKG
jgi:glycosyltransferase involved in cell wall biosynthesis